MPESSKSRVKLDVRCGETVLQPVPRVRDPPRVSSTFMHEPASNLGLGESRALLSSSLNENVRREIWRFRVATCARTRGNLATREFHIEITYRTYLETRNKLCAEIREREISIAR